MNFLEGYKVGRLLWLVYFKQSTWSWLDVENLQRWRRSAVTGKKILRLTSPPVPIWFLIIDPIPIFTLMCAPLTWLANKYSSTQTLTRYRSRAALIARPARKQAPGLAWLDSRVQERQGRQPSWIPRHWRPHANEPDIPYPLIQTDWRHAACVILADEFSEFWEFGYIFVFIW